MSEMDRILEALTGTDNSARKEAEGYLENSKKTAPAQLVEQLFASMSNENLDVSKTPALFLRLSPVLSTPASPASSSRTTS